MNGKLDNTMSREDFLKYLRETLIPDLKQSGKIATAEDFELCCKFMETDVSLFDELLEAPGYSIAGKAMQQIHKALIDALGFEDGMRYFLEGDFLLELPHQSFGLCNIKMGGVAITLMQKTDRWEVINSTGHHPLD